MRAVTFTIRQAIALDRAGERAPQLMRLAPLLAESRARMDVITPLLPPALRTQVQPGVPALGQPWSLLVPNSAAATRLRQLLPTLLEALQRAGHDVPQLRVKVSAPRS